MSISSKVVAAVTSNLAGFASMYPTRILQIYSVLPMRGRMKAYYPAGVRCDPELVEFGCIDISAEVGFTKGVHCNEQPVRRNELVVG